LEHLIQRVQVLTPLGQFFWLEQ
jgi:hypothetical protein